MGMAKSEKEKAADKIWREKNAEKVRAARKAWKLKNPEKVRDSKKRNKKNYAARMSRTPEGLLKILESLKWSKVQTADGSWTPAPWVPQMLSFFPLEKCCAWMQEHGLGVKVVNGTSLEFRHDSRFDIAGDCPTIKCGYKRVRNFDGLREWLSMIPNCDAPDAWQSLDIEPDKRHWAEPLRNLLGHDLTARRTAKGASNPRYPCSLNLAALENWLERRGLLPFLRVGVASDENGAIFVSIYVADAVVWSACIGGDGGLEKGALDEAVDVLKELPFLP